MPTIQNLACKLIEECAVEVSSLKHAISINSTQTKKYGHQQKNTEQATWRNYNKKQRQIRQQYRHTKKR